MLESIGSFNAKHQDFLNISEWIITILFTVEYFARIISVKKPLKYILSFYGIIDLLSTVPKYLSLLFGGTQALVALRALRLLRVFRILKLARYLGASNQLAGAIRDIDNEFLASIKGISNSQLFSSFIKFCSLA